MFMSVHNIIHLQFLEWFVRSNKICLALVSIGSRNKPTCPVSLTYLLLRTWQKSCYRYFTLMNIQFSLISFLKFDWLCTMRHQFCQEFGTEWMLTLSHNLLQLNLPVGYASEACVRVMWSFSQFMIHLWMFFLPLVAYIHVCKCD